MSSEKGSGAGEGSPEHPAALSTPFQPQIIKKLIERKQAQIRKVYPGLTCFKEGVRQIPIESVPGIRESAGCCSGRAVWQEGSVLCCTWGRCDVYTCLLGETGWKPLGKEKG